MNLDGSLDRQTETLTTELLSQPPHGTGVNSEIEYIALFYLAEILSPVNSIPRFATGMVKHCHVDKCLVFPVEPLTARQLKI